MTSFSDAQAVSTYAGNAARQVPGYHHLQTMAGLLLAERAPADGRILVLGAGGGMELDVFARMQPDWRFVGVDPSAAMLDLARTQLGTRAKQVTFHQGYIDDAPEGPFDGAACLLTLHFLPEAERRKTVADVYRRLRPGAPFVVAHHSFRRDGAETEKWLKRFAAFAIASGVPQAQANGAISAMAEKLPALSPELDEAILREAGFSDVELFYAAFSFRGWVGYRG